jgi:hypothetical protein
MEEDYDTNVPVVNKYNFGVPGQVIWFTHIIIGIILAYTGYLIFNEEAVNKNIGLLFLILGVVATLYHAHLWYLNGSK